MKFLIEFSCSLVLSLLPKFSFAGIIVYQDNTVETGMKCVLVFTFIPL